MADPQEAVSYLDMMTDEWHDAVPYKAAYDGPSCVLWWTLRIAEELEAGGQDEGADYLRGLVDGVKAKRDRHGTFGIELEADA